MGHCEPDARPNAVTMVIDTARRNSKSHKAIGPGYSPGPFITLQDSQLPSCNCTAACTVWGFNLIVGRFPAARIRTPGLRHGKGSLQVAMIVPCARWSSPRAQIRARRRKGCRGVPVGAKFTAPEAAAMPAASMAEPPRSAHDVGGFVEEARAIQWSFDHAPRRS